MKEGRANPFSVIDLSTLIKNALSNKKKILKCKRNPLVNK